MALKEQQQIQARTQAVLRKIDGSNEDKDRDHQPPSPCPCKASPHLFAPGISDRFCFAVRPTGWRTIKCSQEAGDQDQEPEEFIHWMPQVPAGIGQAIMVTSRPRG